jgi:hypothetical protein
VRTIQRAWRAWAARRVRRRKRAVSVIEDAVLEALYRPGSGWRFAEVSTVTNGLSRTLHQTRRS